MFTWDKYEVAENDPFENVAESADDIEARVKNMLDHVFSEESAQGECTDSFPISGRLIVIPFQLSQLLHTLDSCTP